MDIRKIEGGFGIVSHIAVVQKHNLTKVKSDMSCIRKEGKEE